MFIPYTIVWWPCTHSVLWNQNIIIKIRLSQWTDFLFCFRLTNILFFFFFFFGGHESFFSGATDTSVLDFWWCLPWVSKPGWIPHLHASLPGHNGFLRFTSGVTPTDLLAASMAASHILYLLYMFTNILTIYCVDHLCPKSFNVFLWYFLLSLCGGMMLTIFSKLTLKSSVFNFVFHL